MNAEVHEIPAWRTIRPVSPNKQQGDKKPPSGRPPPDKPAHDAPDKGGDGDPHIDEYA
ncbi:MAG: hypothetical protein ACLGGU_03655 [Gammaproteobacteria bacterium]